MGFAVLLLATALLVAGYLVLHFSTQAHGRLQVFGKYLSYWVFLLAAIVIVGAFSAQFFRDSPFGIRFMMRDHETMEGYGPRHMRANRGGSAASPPEVQAPVAVAPESFAPEHSQEQPMAEPVDPAPK